jgi:hypothetical protein
MTESKPSTITEFIIRSLRPYVQDHTRRAVVKRETAEGTMRNICVYHDADTGKGCAFGQWLTPEELVEIPEGNVKSVWEKLPEWMRSLFRQWDLALDIQCLHDDDDNWNEDGPTHVFWDRLDRMCRNYHLPHDEIVAGLSVPA